MKAAKWTIAKDCLNESGAIAENIKKIEIKNRPNGGRERSKKEYSDEGEL